MHIFGREKYHPLVRPAILTAFLGYLLVVLALMVDLGRFWNLWRPLVHIQYRSVMFEVAMCVALYTAVLAIEFSPMVFERFKMQKALQFVKKISIGVIIAGVILSTLHQSSLGSVFLIVPHKLHPLWYTPILPLLFLVSAIALGPAMVILEGNLSSKAFKRPYETELMGGLARALPVILGIYLVMKSVDLVAKGAIPPLVRRQYPGGDVLDRTAGRGDSAHRVVDEQRNLQHSCRTVVGSDLRGVWRCSQSPERRSCRNPGGEMGNVLSGVRRNRRDCGTRGTWTRGILLRVEVLRRLSRTSRRSRTSEMR